MESYFAAAATPAASSLAGQTGLHDWQTMTRRGMQACRSGKSVTAMGFYLQALDVAQTLLHTSRGAGFGADDRIAAFVVSHLNLADLHADAGNAGLAADSLCTAHHALVDLMRNPRAIPELRQAACRHSRETRSALLAHVAEHGRHPAIDQALQAGCPSARQSEAPAVLH